MTLAEVLDKKKEIASIIEKMLTPREKREALNDHHAKRPPRPCGMTIHTGIGCSLRCIYCYIEDMGFKWGVKPYPLNGRQLVYALSINPYFIPGRNGTLIAIGSVTEPFLPETTGRTLEYIRYISKYLGNPIQFSTKMTITDEVAAELKKLDPGISPLITIITFKYAKRLEPYAPPPEKRLETIRTLAKHGLKPILFYRPIIPGIAEEEYTDILREAKRHGAVGVVAGSLRVTERILSRLETAGIPIDEIKKRLTQPLQGRRQIPVYTRDIKEKIMKYAEEIGLIAFPEACMANIYTHGYKCWKMTALGINPPDTADPPKIDPGEIMYEIDTGKTRIDRIIREESKGVLKLRIRNADKRTRKLVEEYIKCKYRICVHVI